MGQIPSLFFVLFASPLPYRIAAFPFHYLVAFFAMYIFTSRLPCLILIGSLSPIVTGEGQTEEGGVLTRMAVNAAYNP